MKASCQDRRPWAAAALWLFVLGPVFFVSYAFANWITAERSHVSSFAFGWEHNIPFLAWTIVPYWSIDLLYAASLFISRTHEELNVHAKRLLAVQVLSVAGFLLVPLRFSFNRPAVTQPEAWLFALLAALDRPFNQAPSLHLGLGAILWARYSAHLRGLGRLVMQAWLVLVGASTLTTFQHHFVDLPCGVLAGLLAIALFPMAPNFARRLSAAYFAGSLVLAVLAFRFGGVFWLLLWPACALLLPAAAYATRRPEFFFKRTAGIPVLLAPYLAAAWLNSRLRPIPNVQHVTSGVWIGRAAGRCTYLRNGFHSVVDVTAEFPSHPRQVRYRAVPMLDLLPPDPADLRQGVAAIEEFADHRPTVVFCALGCSRSAAVIGTWLVKTRRVESVSAAVEMMRAERPQIVLGEAHKSAMAEAAAHEL